MQVRVCNVSTNRKTKQNYAYAAVRKTLLPRLPANFIGRMCLISVAIKPFKIQRLWAVSCITYMYAYVFFAGKTAVLYKSKLDDTIYANAVPRGVNIEHIRPKRGARIQVIDLPGNKTTRYLWHDWFYRTEGKTA